MLTLVDRIEILLEHKDIKNYSDGILIVDSWYEKYGNNVLFNEFSIYDYLNKDIIKANEDFGHTSEKIIALKETINLSQLDTFKYILNKLNIPMKDNKLVLNMDKVSNKSVVVSMNNNDLIIDSEDKPNKKINNSINILVEYFNYMLFYDNANVSWQQAVENKLYREIYIYS